MLLYCSEPRSVQEMKPLEKNLASRGVEHSSSVSSRFTGAKIVSEYDQEIPQSQTADNPVALPGRAAQPS